MEQVVAALMEHAAAEPMEQSVADLMEGAAAAQLEQAVVSLMELLSAATPMEQAALEQPIEAMRCRWIKQRRRTRRSKLRRCR